MICYYPLRQLRVDSSSLSCDAAATLINAFVTSRLDHCCLIPRGLPLDLITSHDRVFSCAVRLIGLTQKYAAV